MKQGITLQSKNGLFAVLIAIGLETTIWTGAVRAKEAQQSPMAESKEIKAITPMSRDKFWAIIAQTLPYKANTDQQSNALKRALLAMSPADIAGFESTFEDVMHSSYSWDLWGAASVVHGGASDDGFEYFRVWLISRGQGVFEAVSKDPDNLADIIDGDSSGPLEFEEFAYIARSAWETKTGKSFNAMPRIANMMYPDRKPKGEPFEDSEQYLATRYPKLWKRFGHSPAF